MAGDRVYFIDGNGQKIRGRVVAGRFGESAFRVVFQRGWKWPAEARAVNEREGRSDFEWSFDHKARMLGFETVQVVSEASQ